MEFLFIICGCIAGACGFPWFGAFLILLAFASLLDGIKTRIKAMKL